MSETHPTAPVKPSKPYPDFPLFAHAAGYWAKKIRGKLHYFGPWADSDAALAKYLEQKDALHAGRKPREATGGTTVKDLANAFLNAKQALVDAGELAPRTWAEYKQTTDLLVARFGKSRLVADLGRDDFADLRKALAKRLGPVALGNEIQRVRSVFKHAFDDELIDRPVRFGSTFKKPSKRVMRQARNERGAGMFEAEEVRKLLAGATPTLRAMILLGINCGFGNADVGRLPLSALDLDRGWANFPRPKTGIARRCPLWPETVQAIREALLKRPEPKDPADAELVFLTKYGQRWFKGDTDNPLSAEMRKFLDRLGINGRRNFYALRHTFETVGGESRDQVAVDHIMGHAREDMASAYRERISDERLRAVADHVRAWLFSAPSGGTPAQASAPAGEGPAPVLR
jgi:integrase